MSMDCTFIGAGVSYNIEWVLMYRYLEFVHARWTMYGY